MDFFLCDNCSQNPFKNICYHHHQYALSNLFVDALTSLWPHLSSGLCCRNLKRKFTLLVMVFLNWNYFPKPPADPLTPKKCPLKILLAVLSLLYLNKNDTPHPFPNVP